MHKRKGGSKHGPGISVCAKENLWSLRNKQQNDERLINPSTGLRSSNIAQQIPQGLKGEVLWA